MGIFYLFTAKQLSVGSLRDRGLDVVPLEVLLQVEDGEAVRLREAEELAERGIRLDGLLVRELVVLGVLHDAAGDI